jgi:hypothetical protein
MIYNGVIEKTGESKFVLKDRDTVIPISSNFRLWYIRVLEDNVNKSVTLEGLWEGSPESGSFFVTDIAAFV